MLILKKHKTIALKILFIISLPLTVPFLAQITEMILKAGRIVGTLIRIY